MPCFILRKGEILALTLNKARTVTVATCFSSPALTCSVLLFNYGGKTVEMNLVGCIVPLSISLVMLVALHSRIHSKRVAGFASLSFLGFFAIGSTAEALTGRPYALGIWSYLVIALVSAAYWKNTRLEVFNRASLAEAYAIGTFGELAADVGGCIFGIAGIPILGYPYSVDIWGGAGIGDGVFISGIVMVVFQEVYVLYRSQWKIYSQRRPHLQRPKASIG